MKGFGVLLALASAAILLICGPPALAAGDTQNYLDLQIAQLTADNFTVAETPGASPAVARVVHDPGSCSGHAEAVALNLSKLACRPFRRLGNGVQRLLNFLPRC